MTDDEFEAACGQLAELAEKVAGGTPEQIRDYAEAGWWDASDILRRVYNDWLRDAA